MLGFPLVLVLAWFFEWTPAGLVADGAEPPASAIRLRTRRKLDLAIALLLFGVLGLPRRDVELAGAEYRTRAGASGAGRDPGSAAVQAAPRRHA